MCGFTDAEGCFTCSITNLDNTDRIGGLVRVRYILSQKGNFNQITYLADMLNGKTHYLKSYDGYNLTVNTTKLSKVVDYFSLYPLKTKKNIVYYNWVKIYTIVMDKKHLTNEGFNLIKKYINNMKNFKF